MYTWDLNPEVFRFHIARSRSLRVHPTGPNEEVATFIPEHPSALGSVRPAPGPSLIPAACLNPLATAAPTHTHTHCQEPPHPWPGGRVSKPTAQSLADRWPPQGSATFPPGSAGYQDQEGCCQALIPEAAGHKANPPCWPPGSEGSRGRGVGQGGSQVGPGVGILPRRLEGGPGQPPSPHRLQRPSGLLSQRARRWHC